MQATYGLPLKAYREYADMLADPSIDAIDICTPHPFHAEQAIAAANAGKHLIIEKPIALSWEDAVSVRDAIRANGVKAMVCFEVRYSAQFTLTRSVVEQGLLGELHFAEVDYYHGIGPWYGQYGVEHQEGHGRVQPADRRLPRHGRPADADAVARAGGDRLRHDLEERVLRALRVPDHHGQPAEVRRRQDRQGDLLHRLPAALLLPLAHRRQPRHAARHEAAHDEAAGDDQDEVERAGDAPDRLR